MKNLFINFTNHPSTGWEEKQDYEHAFRMGLSTGSASAFSDLLATREEVMDVYRRLDE